MNLSSITALVADHRVRLEAQAQTSETTINDLRRMATEAIQELDERHRTDTRTAAVLFENLIQREQNRLDEIRAELATEEAPQQLPVLPERKRKDRNHDTASV